MTKYTIKQDYFMLADLETLIAAKFGYKLYNLFRQEHLERDWNSEWTRLNLYYYGPRPSEQEKDASEKERAESVFKQSKFTPMEKANMEIMHFVWDAMESEGHEFDVEDVHFK